jgi:hypothetical protein
VSIVDIIFDIIKLIAILWDVGVMILIISALIYMEKPVYIVDYVGNNNRSIIRYGNLVPNNGMAYCMTHRRKVGSVSSKETFDWIDSNSELYQDIMDERGSIGKYAKKVRVG